MSFEKRNYSALNLGVNLRGLTAGVNVLPGQAQDAIDILPRDDGAILKHYGWRRENATAFSGRVVGIKGFTYKGKNNNSGVNPNRPGNFGIADDGAIFTRRRELWTTQLTFTTAELRMWNPSTLTDDLIALPGGVTVSLAPKPSFVVLNDNLYVVGWASSNLRYDPADRALYLWDWESVPAAPGGALAAGGALVANAVYQYAASWVDLYTGEESELGAISLFTTTAANRTVNFAAAAFANYAGTRHFVGAGTNRDVGINLYRTEALPPGALSGEGEFHFLALLTPDLSTATLLDNGLATDASIKPERGTVIDAPRFNAIEEFKGQIYAVSWDSSHARIYFNEFRRENSFIERFKSLNFMELPLGEGEAVTAVSKTDQSLIAFSQRKAYQIMISIGATGRIERVVRVLPWTVGCVGPKAKWSVNGWIYFLSERGPYRWREELPYPQFIGRDLLPMFIDPSSGLCKLSGGTAILESEVMYDPIAGVVRFIFPRDGATIPNTHLVYWVHDDIPGGPQDPASGWFFASPRAQSFDLTNAREPLSGDGRPVDPFEVKPYFMFGDDDFYLNRYDPASYRGGLGLGIVAQGTDQGGSGATTLVGGTAANPLYTVGQGCRGMRLELVHANGNIEVRKIVSNTSTTFTVDFPWSVTPVSGETWYLAGVPSFWHSWPDHAGDPDRNKAILHLYLGLVRTAASAAEIVDVNVAKGDFPTTVTRARTSRMDVYRNKMLLSLTGRWFVYDFANTRPDESFAITRFGVEYEVHEEREP